MDPGTATVVAASIGAAATLLVAVLQLLQFLLNRKQNAPQPDIAPSTNKANQTSPKTSARIFNLLLGTFLICYSAVYILFGVTGLMAPGKTASSLGFLTFGIFFVSVGIRRIVLALAAPKPQSN
jgi:hypothetical protein